jgi:hypothetical protein
LLRAGEIHQAEPDYLNLNERILACGEATGADTLVTVWNVCTLTLRASEPPATARRGVARAP